MKLDFEKLKNLPYTELQFAEIEKKVDADFVKETRKKLQFNQTLFAELIHVSKKTVEAWEQKKNPIGGGNAIIIYLIHEDPSVATKLLKVVTHNGASVTPKFLPFVVEGTSTTQLFPLLKETWQNDSDKQGGSSQWNEPKWNLTPYQA